MLAGDEDRERAVNVLKDAFTEGRLTQPEYEDRVGRAYQSRTYGELDLVTADIPRRTVPPAFLPQAPAYVPMRMYAPATSGLAVAALVCGICAPLTGFSTIPAVVLGHMAHASIRRTGEQGKGMATAGLVLGYLTMAGYLTVIALFVLLAAGS
jgi:hypothetical protein